MPSSHPVRPVAVLLFAALAALAGACAKKPPPVVKADLSEVEYAGCYEVQREGMVCLLAKKAESRKLSFRPLRQAEAFELRVDGKVFPLTPTPGPAGPIFQLTVPAGASQIELRALTRANIRAWSLRVADWPELPAWLSQGWDLFAQGEAQHAAARALVDREIPHCTDPQVRAAASYLRAALEPKAGKLDRWFSAQENALAQYRRAGFVQGEARLATAVSYERIQQHAFAQARATLRDVSLPSGAPVEAVRRLSHSRGLLAENIGDFRTALGEFEAEAELAGGIGLEAHRSEAEHEEARLLTQLGRFSDAEALLERLTAGERSQAFPCDLAILQTNLGWARYLAREAGEWGLGDPIEPFTQAQRIYLANKDCRDQAREEFNTTLNLALAFLQSNRIKEAERVTAAVRPTAANSIPLERMWWLDLLARLALKQKRAERALALYRQLDETARTTFSTENRWRAAMGTARALEALGRLQEATVSLASAEELVDLQLSRVPVGEGRESFSDQWSAATRLYVELLLRTRRTELAFQVARRARARVLNKLAESARVESLSAEQRRERDSWLTSYWRLRSELDRISNEGWQQPKSRTGELQADLQRRLRETQQALDQVLTSLGGAAASATAQPLHRPTSGELVLAYFPLAAERRWVAFADDGRNVSAREVTMPGGSLRSQAPADLARVLLTPFEREIVAARRLVILPYGLLKAVDFHALPFGGGDKVLLSDRPVIYGLDIADRRPDLPAGGLKALVVADSRGDLPDARKEGIAAEAALGRLRPRWSVRLLQGEEATAQAVRQGILGGVDVMHYAGHADFSGRGGWESQIPLAQQSRLTLGDILTLSRQPRWVVLSGCETGASDGSAQVESQGLAHAFLLGGSRAVVAATRKVNDKVARSLVLEMYKNMRSTPDLAVLLQQAQLALRNRRVQQREWASFRVFEP